MGYYTTFEISSNDGRISEHMEEINKISGYEYYQEVKWYDHENDMKKYSKKHPEVKFSLDFTGEEKGDFGVKYFQNGKMQVCLAVITIPKFDPSKLA